MTAQNQPHSLPTDSLGVPEHQIPGMRRERISSGGDGSLGERTERIAGSKESFQFSTQTTFFDNNCFPAYNDTAAYMTEQLPLKLKVDQNLSRKDMRACVWMPESSKQGQVSIHTCVLNLSSDTTSGTLASAYVGKDM